ncbi:hypothetical protein HU200_060134 [Digitaria exilis]|uniref:Uncharacterized protein n=1 Tax=Digitaria exilis TaxID=1010633 RepID=A0A835E2J7_9POAL|nr:hypothetical protein HU200_060134 [Digitaria exilis]
MDMAFWFVSLACLGALYVATICARPLAYLALCLRRPKDLHSYGSWAIVTGPTSGLGRSMAMELARRGFNLVLLDLDAGNLLETTDAIKALHSVKIKTVVFDLSLVATPQGDRVFFFFSGWFRKYTRQKDCLSKYREKTRQILRHSAKRLFANQRRFLVGYAMPTDCDELCVLVVGDEAMGRLREAMDGLDVGLLVNNAAVNTPGAVYLHEADIERFVRMIRVNLWGLTEGDGGGAAADAGAGEGRHRERRLGVPFYVHTRMLSSAAKAKLRPWFVATADEYTRTAARWIGNGPLCVPGAAQKLQWCLTGFVPDWVHDWYRIRLHLQHRAVTRAARSGSRNRGHAVATRNGNSVGPKIRG